MQGTHLPFEPHLSFQKMQEHHLIDSFSLLAEFFRGFFSLAAFEKRGEHS